MPCHCLRIKCKSLNQAYRAFLWVNLYLTVQSPFFMPSPVELGLPVKQNYMQFQKRPMCHDVMSLHGLLLWDILSIIAPDWHRAASSLSSNHACPNLPSGPVFSFRGPSEGSLPFHTVLLFVIVRIRICLVCCRYTGL